MGKTKIPLPCKMATKFCGQCGSTLEENTVFCTKCGAKTEALGDSSIVSPSGVNNVTAETTISPPIKSRKSAVTALLLCLFLGSLSVHRFYVGKIGTGIVILQDASQTNNQFVNGQSQVENSLGHC